MKCKNTTVAIWVEHCDPLMFCGVLFFESPWTVGFSKYFGYFFQWDWDALIMLRPDQVK